MKSYLAYSLIFIFLFLLVDGALPQLQMALMGGRVVIPNIAIKFYLILVLMTGFLLHALKKGSIVWPRVAGIAYFLFLAYLVVHFIIMSEELPSGYLLFSYNGNYFFYIIYPLTVYLSVSAITVKKWLFFACIPLIAIGMAQFFTNSTIVPTVSQDGFFEVFSWRYYEKVRAFSLFSSGLQYGYFLSLLAPFAIYSMFKGRGAAKITAVLFFLVVSFACYTTYTRNIYIQYTFTVIASVVLLLWHKKPSSRVFSIFVRFIPVTFGITSALLVIIAQVYISTHFQDSLVIKDETLFMRFMAWAQYFELWTGSGLMKLFFGLGLISSARFDFTGDVIIDNSFLAIGVHIGLIGLVLLIAIMWRLWKWLLHVSRRFPDNIGVFAVTAYWSTWISSGLFNITFNLYPVMVMILMPICHSHMKNMQCRKVREKGTTPGSTEGCVNLNIR